MTRFRLLAALLLLLAVLQSVLIVRSRALGETRDRALADGEAVTRALGLTDLAVWTEARYTRHPSLADRGTAFQDHPGALEHFPAGSVVAPPPHLLPANAGAGTGP